MDESSGSEQLLGRIETLERFRRRTHAAALVLLVGSLATLIAAQDARSPRVLKADRIEVHACDIVDDTRGEPRIRASLALDGNVPGAVSLIFYDASDEVEQVRLIAQPGGSSLELRTEWKAGYARMEVTPDATELALGSDSKTAAGLRATKATGELWLDGLQPGADGQPRITRVFSKP